jgi:hypothetical protein
MSMKCHNQIIRIPTENDNIGIPSDLLKTNKY